MAIDDNKLYNLKGSQLKDLSDKVKAKADQATTYTKAEVDGLIPDVSGFATTQALTDGLATKADASSTYSKTDVDGLLADKADKATTYTKTEVDGLIPDVSGFATKTELSEGLADKADADTTYTKTEVDTALAAKADTSTTYTKTEVDTALSAKADTATTYTKTEVDALIPDITPLATKTEVTDGLALKSDKSTTYTKTEVDDLLDANKEVLVAVYEQTSYADVKAAIDAHKAIVLDMPANNNQFCMTFSTYTNGGNVIMYAIFKMSNDRSTLMTVTLTPQDQWTISHTDLQDKLVSGTNIKTVNGNSLLGSGDITITGGAEFEITASSDSASLGQGNDYLGVDLSDANGPTLTLTQPGTYAKSKTLATKDYVEGLSDNIGTLTSLTTTDKTNLVGAVNEVNGKTGVHIAVDQETWYGTYTDENGVTYQTYTKTIYIPALPSAAGITNYPIGVSNMKQIISISGVTADGFVLNAPRQNAVDNITIYQTSKGSQTFSIEVGKDRSNKSAYVTIIYAKNN